MHSVAIVGCGLIATEKYLPIFKQLGRRARIAGICDLDTAILERAATRFGISQTYTDFAELASSQNPDVVVICTPPATHRPLAIQAMESGANVLIEKPMALSGSECDEMIAVGESQGRKIGVMHNQVFNPAIDKARKAMAKPGFGRLLGVRIFLATSIDYMTSIPDHWAHRLPGGVVGETGPHAVYLSQAFLGEVDKASVWHRKLYPEFTWSIAEDVRMSLTCADGMSSVTLTYGSTQTAAEVDLIGSEDIIRLDLQGRSAIRLNRPNLRARTVAGSMLGTARQTAVAALGNAAGFVFNRAGLNPHWIGVNRFLDHLDTGAGYPATGEDGRRVVTAMEMISREMEAVKLEG